MCRNQSFTWITFEKDVYNKFIGRFIEEVDGAFEQLESWLNFVVFDPRKLPDDKAELNEYGNLEIDQLISFYGEEKSDEYKGKVNTQGPDINKLEMRAE